MAPAALIVERIRTIRSSDTGPPAGAIKVNIGNYTLSQGQTVTIARAPGLSGVALENDREETPVRHFRAAPDACYLSAGS